MIYYTAGIARLLSDGSLDSAFGELGSKMLNLGVGQEIGRDALIQQDGKILIIGDQSFRASPNYSPGGGDFLIARLNVTSISVQETRIAVSEGLVASNTGKWSGISTMEASIGTVVQLDDGTWNWQYATSDGPEQSQTVTISGTDSSGNLQEVTFELTVLNVAPYLTMTSTRLSVNEGQRAINSGNWGDRATTRLC